MFLLKIKQDRAFQAPETLFIYLLLILGPMYGLNFWQNWGWDLHRAANLETSVQGHRRHTRWLDSTPATLLVSASHPHLNPSRAGRGSHSLHRKEQEWSYRGAESPRVQERDAGMELRPLPHIPLTPLLRDKHPRLMRSACVDLSALISHCFPTSNSSWCPSFLGSHTDIPILCTITATVTPTWMTPSLTLNSDVPP